MKMISSQNYELEIIKADTHLETRSFGEIRCFPDQLATFF